MKKSRSCCPIACTLDLIGDRWTMLVIRDLLLGRSHFKEFMASPEKIATNILANRLQRLVEHGLAERFSSPSVPGKDAYRLTPKGKSLKPIISSIVKWGLQNLEGTEAKMLAKQ